MMIIILIYAAIFGLLIGSFVNVLIDRLPEGESVVYGRSRCDGCKKTLRWFELIPVLSFLLQRGRCRRCHVRLRAQYLIVELVVAISISILFSYFIATPVLFIASVLLFIALFVIVIVDLRHQIIPDSMVVLGLVGAVLYQFHLNSFGFHAWLTVFLSGLGSFVFFYSLWLLTRGRGMGLGDVKFSFFLGILLSFPGTIIALYIAFLTGAAVGVILIVRGTYSSKSRVPFGPFLVLGTVATLFWGSQLLAWSRLLFRL